MWKHLRHPIERIQWDSSGPFLGLLWTNRCFRGQHISALAAGDCDAMLCGKARTNQKHPNGMSGREMIETVPNWMLMVGFTAFLLMGSYILHNQLTSENSCRRGQVFFPRRYQIHGGHHCTTPKVLLLSALAKRRPCPTLINTYSCFLEITAILASFFSFSSWICVLKDFWFPKALSVKWWTWDQGHQGTMQLGAAIIDGMKLGVEWGPALEALRLIWKK